MSTSTIEWTEETWNPVAGCALVSPGCTNCYAMRMAARLAAMGQAKYAGTTHKVNGRHVWMGKINLAEEALAIPLKRRKPTTWFVNSMSDLFHEDVPFDYVDRVFAVMALCPQHIFQILTKRPERMADYFVVDRGPYKFECDHTTSEFWIDSARDDQALAGGHPSGVERLNEMPWPLPNVWLGTSVEDQKRADERIPHLLKCPAAVRFLSVEPLLGSVDILNVCRTPGAAPDEITDEDYELGSPLGGASGIDWVIVGGESGPGARPMNVEWARSIVRQCKDAGVPVFVKQLGTKPYLHPDKGPRVELELKDQKGGDMAEWGTDLQIRQMPAGVGFTATT